MTEQWQELKETITEMRDNDGTGTQQDACKFLANLMDVLEKQMREPCEDCISRKAVLDLVADYDLNMGQVVKGIHALPSVTPQRPKGKWIGHGEHCENLGVMPSGLGAYEWCSNCDCGIDVIEWHRNHYNYCPNCGAEMEVEDAEKR